MPPPPGVGAEDEVRGCALHRTVQVTPPPTVGQGVEVGKSYRQAGGARGARAGDGFFLRLSLRRNTLLPGANLFEIFDGTA